MYPSGVFVTDDGGRHWRPLPGSGAAGWLAADFLDLRTGALAGRNGVAGRGQPRRNRGGPIGSIRPAEPGRRCGWCRRPTAGWWATAALVRITRRSRLDLAGPARRVARRRPDSSISPPWRFAGRSAGSPARPARACFTPPTPAAPGTLWPPARPCRCGRSALPTTSTAGPPASWARSWPPATAGGPGSGSGPAASGPRCWRCWPSPTTCRWN